jgi:diadenosine tetraphosphate (Ap4A) HIT family hydrolase
MEAGSDRLAVARLQTGYVHLERSQSYRGYTFFSATSCVAELHELPSEERRLHLYEMAEVAHAVWRAFSPRKLNYEALGNTERHLHWHIVPRHVDDPRGFAPIWENLDYLRLVWTGAQETDAAIMSHLAGALLAELRPADVVIEAVFA